MKKVSLVVLASTVLISAGANATITSKPSTIYAQQQEQSSQLMAPQSVMSNDYGAIGNMTVEQEKAKNETPTAAEQGYISQEAQDAARERMEDFISNNTARQKGITIQVPTENVGVAKNKKDKMWLFNWKGRLMDRGISPEKIDFEANRLNKYDFERWASRQIRYADGQ